MFFGMKENNSVPYSKTEYGKKQNQINEKSKFILESAYNSIQRENLDKEVEKASLLEESFRGMSNQKVRNNREQQAVKNKILNDLTKKTLSRFLSESVINGLIFDHDYMYTNKKTIKRNLDKFFNEEFDKGNLSYKLFTKSDSLLMRDIFSNVVRTVEKKYENRNTVNVFDEEYIIDKIFNEAEGTAETAKEIGEIVKNKVIDTLIAEKKIAKSKEEEEKEAADQIDQIGSDADIEDTNNDVEEPEDDSSEDGIEDDNQDSDENEEDDGGIEENNPDGDVSESDDDSSEEGIEDDNQDSENNNDMEESETEEDNSDEEISESDDDDSSEDGTKVTVNNGKTKITITTLKAESGEYFQIFGSSNKKNVNKNSIFKNILENCLKEEYAYQKKEQRKLLNESYGNSKKKIKISMDKVLSESIINYSILETLYTSKLFNLNQNDINAIKKNLNLNR